MKKVRTPTRRRSPAPAIAESARARIRGREPAAADLTYADVLAIVRLIESGSRFSQFRLKSGGIEVEIQRANGSAADEVGSRAVAAAGEEIGSRDPISLPAG